MIDIMIDTDVCKCGHKFYEHSYVPFGKDTYCEVCEQIETDRVMWLRKKQVETINDYQILRRKQNLSRKMMLGLIEKEFERLKEKML